MIASADPSSKLLVIAIVLPILVVGGFFLIRFIRARLKRDETSAGQAFTLQDLRQLRDTGQITQREFEAMRAAAHWPADSLTASQASGAQ